MAVSYPTVAHTAWAVGQLGLPYATLGPKWSLRGWGEGFLLVLKATRDRELHHRAGDHQRGLSLKGLKGVGKVKGVGCGVRVLDEGMCPGRRDLFPRDVLTT